MIGSIVGGALGAAGSIFGGISASKAMRRIRRNIQDQKRRNQDWFDRRYNEDATQRADAQRILTRTEDSIRSRNRQAAGVQAVMGGTEEALAAAKAANNEALAEGASRIAVNGEARKDGIEQQFQSRERQLDDALNNIEAQKAQEVSKAVQGVAQAGAGIASSF